MKDLKYRIIEGVLDVDDDIEEKDLSEYVIDQIRLVMRKYIVGSEYIDKMFEDAELSRGILRIQRFHRIPFYICADTLEVMRKFDITKVIAEKVGKVEIYTDGDLDCARIEFEFPKACVNINSRPNEDIKNLNMTCGCINVDNYPTSFKSCNINVLGHIIYAQNEHSISCSYGGDIISDKIINIQPKLNQHSLYIEPILTNSQNRTDELVDNRYITRKKYLFQPLDTDIINPKMTPDKLYKFIDFNKGASVCIAPQGSTRCPDMGSLLNVIFVHSKYANKQLSTQKISGSDIVMQYIMA